MAKMIILEVEFSTASSIDVVVIPLSTNKCLKIFGKRPNRNNNLHTVIIVIFISKLEKILSTTKLLLNVPFA